MTDTHPMTAERLAEIEAKDDKVVYAAACREFGFEPEDLGDCTSTHLHEEISYAAINGLIRDRAELLAEVKRLHDALHSECRTVEDTQAQNTLMRGALAPFAKMLPCDEGGLTDHSIVIRFNGIPLTLGWLKSVKALMGVLKSELAELQRLYADANCSVCHGSGRTPAQYIGHEGRAATFKCKCVKAR